MGGSNLNEAANFDEDSENGGHSGMPSDIHSGSHSISMKEHMSKIDRKYGEQEFKAGLWNVGTVLQSQQKYEVDVSSVDIFSLARHGKFLQLQALMEHGVDPNSKDRFGNTVLIVGAQNGNKSIVKLALRHGGLINMTNCLGNTALHFATEFKYEKVRKYLLEKGANTTITNMRGYRACEGIGPSQNIDHILQTMSNENKGTDIRL